MDEKNVIKKKRRLINIHLSTTQIIVNGFFLAIMIGTALLTLPISSADGSFTPVIDAMFTATTSICVTGLTTVATYSHWSPFGKTIVLLLIQLGGLGVVCFAVTVMLILGKRITMKERILIQESYNLDNLQGLVKLIKKVIKGTFLVEGIGAVFFSLQFIPDYGLVNGIVKSIFHSVSSFCNAGIDIIGDYSFIPYRDSAVVNFTTMSLIVVGGIGFTVWWDLIRVIKEAKANKAWKGQLFKRLSLHSKLAISVTVFLIFSGTLLFLLFEFGNPDTIGKLPFGNKIMSCMFESVTTRTAGYQTILQQNFTDTSNMVIILLMIIGGSPVGTAGGMKTTTVAMLFFVVISVIQGKKDTEIFDRKVSSDNIKTGLSVVFISIAVLFTATLLLSMTEKFSLLDVGFEAASAFGTVGLTRGITPNLTFWGKLILIIVMFIGRTGPITMAMAFSLKNAKKTNLRELPEKKILVG